VPEEGASGTSGLQASMRCEIPAESLSFIKDTDVKHMPGVFRLQAFRSRGAVDEDNPSRLRLYFLQAPHFANPEPAPGETRLSELGDKTFLAQTDKRTLEVYVFPDAAGSSWRLHVVLPWRSWFALTRLHYSDASAAYLSSLPLPPCTHVYTHHLGSPPADTSE